MADRNEIVQQLFEAIDAIITKRLENVQFDKTIVGTITDNSRASYGRYQVTTDNNIRFTAYSDIVTYEIGDKVYIRIPDNDYTKQKVIIDKYISDNQNTIVQETKMKQVELLKDEINTTRESFEKTIAAIRADIDTINKQIDIINGKKDVVNNDIINTSNENRDY